MKLKVGNGELIEWFNKASDEELMFIAMVSQGSIQRLCMLLTLEHQILREKD
jgi:hypothetical protein